MSLFRLDRFLSLHLFYHLLKLRPKRVKIRIPILMYHSISEKKHMIGPYFETSTSPHIFENQLRFLYQENYSVIDLREIFQKFENIKALLEKPVVLTFDDGFHNFYSNAFPVLRKYKYPSTVFLPTDFIGQRNLEFKDTECLSWIEIEKLHQEGVSFGSHTVNHPKLNTLQMNRIEYELRKSKEQIENHIDEPVDTFSYPFAFPEQDKEFTRNLRVLLEQCNYKCGVTTRIGTSSLADGPFFLKRIPVNSYDDQSFFRAKLEGAYDWLWYPQKIKKVIQGKLLK